MIGMIAPVHCDTSCIEVFGNSPQVYDWYLNDFYNRLIRSGPAARVTARKLARPPQPA